MLVLPGSPAFSAARLARHLARIQQKSPAVSSVTATFVHFVETDGEPTPDERRVLEQLLTYGPRAGEARAQERAETHALWVVPRIGTTSPWSTKATDIARSCGLGARVTRIERGVRWSFAGSIDDAAALHADIHDRMTETVLTRVEDAARLFVRQEPKRLRTIPVLARGRAALEEADRDLGLALADDEIDYLARGFQELGRDPTDVELMMFAQANSEHCRHKIFNAELDIDGVRQPKSLFQMIRRTTEASPAGVLSAYKDNAAVIEGPVAGRFFPDPTTGVYGAVREPVHVLMKVETHNHPTAISPHPGAATGSGGEIRDEGATGRGAKPKAGLVGFTVSNLRLPNAVRPWEIDAGKPRRIASALDIMLEGPIGAAAFNNEFGRPALCGYFRTFEVAVPGPDGAREVRGYHKPIMLAGGLGNVRAAHVEKGELPSGAALVVLGGPAMLIGLGGGAASSMAAGTSQEDLDFASVQRDNAEMQRRCQEVIDRCWALGEANPIVSIHDVGAGGLSNAIPELVNDSARGARLSLRAIPSDDPNMSPLELWCNEAQERYVLAVSRDELGSFEAICARERCPYATVGEVTSERRLVASDAHFGDAPIDVPLSLILGEPPRMRRAASRVPAPREPLDAGAIDLRDAAYRVLMLPAVADKTFLVTIGDRSVTGLVAREPMVGRFQVPVADCAVTTTSFDTFTGEAMAIGERTPVAVLDAAASARLAVAEAITNIAAAPIRALGDVKLSANWMAAAGHPGEDARLYDAVRAVGEELCPALGIAIPVGKDSMSMRTVWTEDGEEKAVVSPLSLVVSAFAPVTDARQVLTPELRLDDGETDLWLVDLSLGEHRLGASALAQVLGRIGERPADLDDPALLQGFFAAVQQLRGTLLAYHDRSDGGLFAALVEMAFASGAGLDVDLAPLSGDPAAILFAEEPGAVLQASTMSAARVRDVFAAHGLDGALHRIGRPTPGARVVIRRGGDVLLDEARADLRAAWSDTTYRMQALRDDPACAAEEHETRCDATDPGLFAELTFDPSEDVAAPIASRAGRGARPRVAIVREQGVNGQLEMAAAFDRAGFEAVDVHMSDVFAGRVDLATFRGLAACGGFSYGDVLGAGEGWAKSILYNARARAAFAAFFARTDTFTLGVCNGCQMLSSLKELIPGAERWPRFVRNRSDQFEARLSLVRVEPSPSVLLRGMEGSVVPVPVAHGEGRATLDGAHLASLEERRLIAARFVDHRGLVTERYPENPSGSPRGITALTTDDGRVTILMPHPERVFRAVTCSWRPDRSCEDGPWMRLYRNARVFCG